MSENLIKIESKIETLEFGLSNGSIWDAECNFKKLKYMIKLCYFEFTHF